MPINSDTNNNIDHTLDEYKLTDNEKKLIETIFSL